MSKRQPRGPRAITFFNTPVESTLSFKDAVEKAIASLKTIQRDKRALALYEIATEIEVNPKEITEFSA